MSVSSFKQRSTIVSVFMTLVDAPSEMSNYEAFQYQRAGFEVLEDGESEVCLLEHQSNLLSDNRGTRKFTQASGMTSDYRSPHLSNVSIPKGGQSSAVNETARLKGKIE